MANTNILERIKSSGSFASVDAKWGPYASVAAAHAKLGENGDDVAVVGLTVGIVTGNTVTEYWYQGGTTQAHLVPKQAVVESTPEIDINELDDMIYVRDGQGIATQNVNIDIVNADSPLMYNVVGSVTANGQPRVIKVGVLFLTSDSSRHTITQILITHFVVRQDGGLDPTSHSDSELLHVYRNFYMQGAHGVGESERNKWSKWKRFNSDYFEQIGAMLAAKADKSYVDGQLSGKVDKVADKGLSTNDYTNDDKQAVATIGNKANASDVYLKADTYNKTDVDNKVDVAVAGAAFLGDEEGEASVADFDPRTDTLWKKEQLLTNTEKAAVKSNLGITQDLAEMRSEIDAQKTAVSMLDGHDLVVVDTLPTSESLAVAPDTDKIYRLVVTNGNDVSYEDYMYTEATMTAVPKKVATYSLPGVDEEPTPESQNLVKSKGIQSAIADVEKDLYVPMKLTECPYAILENGKFGSGNSYRHCALAVVAGEKYLIKGFSVARYAFATTDEYIAGGDVPVIDGTSVTTAYDNTYYPVIIPAGCTWLLVNSASENNDVRKYSGSVSDQIEDAISGLDVDVSEAYINDYKEVETIDLETLGSYSQRVGSYASGSWRLVSGSSTAYHLIFDVFGDDCMIKVTANNNRPSHVAFIDDISYPMENEAVPFVEGTSCITIDAGETKYLIVPKETVALLVYLGNPNTDYAYKPDALTIYRNRNTRSVDGIAVNANYMTVNNDTGVIEYSTAYIGKALKVRNGDILYVNASSAKTRIKKAGFLDTLPANNSLVAVNTNVETTNLYKQYVADRDGWFVYFGKDNTGFSVNYQSGARDAVVKKDEASFKNYLSTLNYKKIDLFELPLYKVAYLAYGVFGNSSYRSVFVDVREASFVKIAPPNSNNTYCRIGWVTEIGTPADVGIPNYVPSCPGAINVYGTQVLEVPSGANYMLIYLGAPSSDYTFAPSYVGLYGTVSEDEGSFNSYEQLIVDFNARRDRNLTEHSNIGLTPRIIPVDDNGWEIPESLQQLNAQKKTEQLVNIRWTPKWDVPAKSGSNYTANTEVTTGIPYSSNNDDGSKTVGEETSIHTFMTAVDNPYSLLYTECVNNETMRPSASSPNAPRQASYWGKTYTLSSNGYAYYGTVCCGLTSSVENSPIKWNNGVIRNYTLSNGVYVPVCAPGVVDFNLLKIGDVCDNTAHSFLIYGLHRDSNGEIDQVKFAESTSGYRNGGCRIVTKTKQDFADHVNKSGNPFTVFRYVKLWANTDYEPSEYVPLTARGETETAVTYNNAICTFAGDKCIFRVGDLIVVNYNLYGTQAHDWTKIQIYKDDVLLSEYTLAEAEQTLVNYLLDNEVTPNPFNPTIDEHNHALVLGTELTEGMYKACMVDANDNASDYTYWEVIDNAVAAVKLGKDEYEITIGGTHLIQTIYVNLVSMYYLPTYEEQQARKFIVRPAALAKLFGKTDTGYEVSVKLAGVYGSVTTVPVTLQDGDITPDVEPDDD